MTRISEERRLCLIIHALNLSAGICDESDLSLLAFTAADSLHCGWEGAETASDGFRCSDEEQRLPVYCPVLRSPVQRGDANTLLFSHHQCLIDCFCICYLLTGLYLCLQGDCWICMELMSTSLDKFYKYVYCALDDVIPEEILGKITLAVSHRSHILTKAYVL